MSDTEFVIELKSFNEGLGPLTHIDDKTFLGSGGQASDMCADVVSNPGYIQQSPLLVDLSQGNQAGAVTELIRAILDTPTAADTTFGVGTSKLFKITSSSVTNTGAFPAVITDMVEGESVIRMKENLFVFYNKLVGGDIAVIPLATEVIDPDWGSTVDGGEALEKAPHPSAVKEDILLFGNGRYVGAYIAGLNSLDVKKLDFGEGSEVADIVFNANLWWIAVNYGEGRKAQVYLYDGSAISNTLSDEAGLGNQQIGFLYVQNGNVFVAYEDKTSSGFTIGWVAGRAIKPLRYFKGSLPNHRQKTLYENTILFISGGKVYSCGASVDQLPLQISQLTDPGYDTVGALAAPFGTPMVASSDGSNYRLAKFSGVSKASYWKSVFLETSQDRRIGGITAMIVESKPLAAGAKCFITLEGDNGVIQSTSLEYSGVGKQRQVFTSINLPRVANVRVVVSYDYDGVAETVVCPIRKITLMGNWNEQ